MSGEGRLAEAKALLARLIAFDSVSDASNLPVVDFVEAYLRSQGLEARRAPNAAGDKAAIMATIGPRVDGGVVLSGHTDVVPVEGQPWSSPPFRLREASGRLYGRGACDMKGFDACVLAMAPAFRDAGLKRPVHIVLSYDEETTCLGSRDVIAWFGADEPLPAAVIVGEPTMMAVADAHKSVATFRTLVTGREAHSALPALGANAVAVAADIVSEIGAPSARVRGGPARPALHAALFNASRRHDPGRDGAQHPGAGMRVPLGVSRPARRLDRLGDGQGAGIRRCGRDRRGSHDSSRARRSRRRWRSTCRRSPPRRARRPSAWR